MTNPTPTPLAIARELRRLAKSRYSIRDAVRDRLLMLADEAVALSEPAVAGGLDPEQEIRARALDAAVRARWTEGRYEHVQELVQIADVLAAWIRDGSRP